MDYLLNKTHKALLKRFDTFSEQLSMLDAISEDANLADSYIKTWIATQRSAIETRKDPKLINYLGKLTRYGYLSHGLLEILSEGIIRLLGQNRFLKYVVPPGYGRSSGKLDVISLCIIRRALSIYSSLADTLFAIQGLGSYPISFAGSAAQKKKYLPKIARGELIPAFAMTEPEAGSDLSSIKTTAIPKKGGYLIRGIKTFITNAGIADLYTVFANVPGKGKKNSMTAFVIETNTKGVFITKRLEMMSPHPIGEIIFDCFIPANSRIGHEGEGMLIAKKTLGIFRTTVGAAAIGLATRALQEAINYTQNRKQFGKYLSDFQGVKFELAEMATDLKACELMVFNSAWQVNHNKASYEPSMAKLIATEKAQTIIDRALQLHGGVGVMKGSIVERLYREIRALRIYEGASEIQKLIIAKKILNQ
ncbi:MAG: acyl-CoA dehydrogenase family protein [Planctomycetes bacterium]|nr:acyl-CoA dehydrogenase family protein [Planctomycetota bacterium]